MSQAEVWRLTASEMLGHLASGELTSVALIQALRARIQAHDPALRAFVMLRDEALDEAHRADQARARGEARGALHGLPITIKDNVEVVGTASTLGLAARRHHRAAKDAVLVEALREQGAIVLGKTNVPQLLLAQETENATFGVTGNPWHLDRVPGGSSGGEAAAIAAGMSPLGVGTDIGGSIRIPAHFCGVYGLKPTLDRWSNRGSIGAILGQEVVRSQIGVLARSQRDLSLAWRSVDPRAMARSDPRVPPLRAGDPIDVDLSGLTIGYVDDDPFLAPVPSIQRAIRRACDVLSAAGAAVVPHRPVSSDDLVYLWLAALGADGLRTMDAALDGEEAIPQLKPARALNQLPPLARRAAATVAEQLGERRVARLLTSVGEKGVDELWRLTQRRTELRNEEFDRWARGRLDALICPPHVVPALPHRDSGDFILSLGSTFRWSLLDFPAGVAPITRVERDDLGRYRAGTERIDKKVAAIDAASIGLPVGVQVVGRPYREDVVLAVMGALETGVGGDAGYPKTPVTPRRM